MPETKQEAKPKSNGGAPVPVGTAVLYQPLQNEFPMHREQQAAIVTHYNEVTEQYMLTVFLANAAYVVSRTGTKEGEEDGTFQKLGAESTTAVALKEEKEQKEKELKMAQEEQEKNKDKEKEQEKDKPRPGQTPPPQRPPNQPQR